MRREVLAGQDALGEGRPHDLAHSLLLAQGDDLGLDDAPDHRVLGLVRDDAIEAHVVGEAQRVVNLRRRPFRDADVVHLALADQVVEGPHRLLQRGLVVEPVGLEEVDVVGLQPLQRGMERLHDVLARETAVVRVGAGGPVDLGEDLDGVAPHAFERTAQHRLGPPQGVDVGRVEGGDPRIERGLHARCRGLLLNLAPVGDPVPVGEGRDDHAGASEVSVVHGPGAYPGARTLVVWPPRRRCTCIAGLEVPLSEISWRATTSGGPGGQHANRTLSRVEVQFDVAASPTLGPRQRARLLERLGPVVRASASESRSQARNRELALGASGDQARFGPPGATGTDAHPADQELPGAPGGGQTATCPDEAAAAAAPGG